MKSIAQLRQPALASGLLLAVVVSAYGQLAGSISGPVWGYVLDENVRSLRPVRGIPGSSTLGDPIELGFAISHALFLDARHIIAAVDRSNDPVVLDLSISPPSILAISGITAGIDLWAASVDGTSAAFVNRDVSRIWVVTGLPQKPTVQPLDVSFAGTVTQIAVSNDGKLLVYSIAEDGAESLYSWTAATNNARFVTSAGSISSIAVANGDAIAADRASNEIFAIWDAGGTAVRKFLAGAQDGVSNPSGVAISAENRIHIANSDSLAVMTLEWSGRVLSTRQCACIPSLFSPMTASVFRLTRGLDHTLYLFDASLNGGQILFVPRLEGTR